MPIVALLQLVNGLLPLGVSVIAEFRRNKATGTTDVLLTISQADAQFDANIAQATAALAAMEAQKNS